MSLIRLKFIKLFLLVLALMAQGKEQAWAQAEDYNDRQYHSSQAMAQRQCTDSQEWSAQRNMCVTTESSKARRDDARKCSKIEDADARKACHDKVAASETGVSKGDEYSDSGMLDMSIPALTAAMSGTMMITSKKIMGPCLSLTTMAGTSVVGLASEFFYKKQAKKKLEELQEDYEKETASDDAYHAQKRAFEFLKKEQELIAEFEEKRRNTMFVMTAGYAAAATLAFTVDQGVSSCATEDGEGPESPEGADDPGGLEKTTNFIQGSLSSPKVVGASAGVAGIATLALGMEAAKQAKNASANAETVQKMIDKFDADFEQFCPQGRSDMSEPACFCYNLDGSKNQDRTNSQTCQNYWAKRDKNLFAEAGDYSSRKKQGPAKGCAFINGNFDQDCKCKKMKNDEGQNACFKVGVPSSVAGNLSGAVGLPRTLGRLNKSAEGGINGGVFDAEQLSRDAQATNKAAQRIMEKSLQDKKGKKAPSAREMLAKKVEDIPQAAIEQMNAATGASPSGTAAMMRPQNPELKAALKKAGVKESTAPTDIGYAKSGTDLQKNRADNKKEDEDFFGDWGESSGGAGQGQELTFMDKKYQYKQNDIVDREGISLWEIISKRYTQTGLRRLFPDEKQPLEDLN